MVEGLLSVWMGYLIIRTTTIHRKGVKQSGSYSVRLAGGVICYTGISGLNRLYNWYPQDFLDPYKNSFVYLIGVPAVLVGVLIIALYHDFKKDPVRKLREKPQILLPTWDMWLITAALFLFLLYYTLSI